MWDLHTFTLVHVAISLAGILSGLVVLFGLLTGRRLDHWTSFFLLTTAVTSATGLFFPFHGFTPAMGGSIISLLALAVAVFARYARHLAGPWRRIYVASATFALYLNVFSLIVQAFLKVPSLKSMAPTLSETPFLAVQILTVILFIVLGILAATRFRPAPVPV
jgi:hypothetical protein